jgi:hypothetical protein
MNQTIRTAIILVLGLVIGGVYVVYFTNWLLPSDMKMAVQQRPIPVKPKEIPPAQTVAFVFDKRYAITEIKVVPLLNGKYNEFSLPAWHLIAHSNSVPTRGFAYGDNVRGMIPGAPHAKTYPLEPNVSYRVLISAGKKHAEFDFTAKPAPVIGGGPPPETPPAAPAPAPAPAPATSAAATTQ